ncbi:MAG TPA: ABC transporter permease [Aggregatilineales bacterium]|nr:ABC transporter permease [Aggregatilineales bacterium]
MASTAQPERVDVRTGQPVAPHVLRKWLRKFSKSYTGRVVVQGLFTIWAVTTITFFLIRLMPGNPLDIKIDQLQRTQGLSYQEARARAAGLFGFDPDQPIFEQYVVYVGRLIQGDLGQSITSGGISVSSEILQFLPWTLFSVGLGLLVSFGLGILIGLAMAYWRGGILDNVMTVVSSILYGIPDYIIPLLLIIVVGIQWGLFSPGEMRGGIDPTLTPGFTPEYIGSLFKFALLPVTTYVLASIGGWVLTMKSSTISTLGEDYINVAKARGLSERRILIGYVGRNAMLPLVTRLAISIGFVVGGSVIVEELFQYPGIGRNLLRAINARDYTTMQGMFLVITIAVILSNVGADLLFGLLDPRVRLGGEGDDT